MKRTLQSLAATPLIAVLTLTSCSTNPQTEQVRFPYAGQTLSVVNTNHNMPVNVSASAATGEVLVQVRTQTKGKRANTPAWSLSDGVLNLGTPCSNGVVGYCEGSYSVAVPKGVKVLVNGQPRAAE